METNATTLLRSGLDPTPVKGQFVSCSVRELRPHPSYARHDLSVQAYKLASLADLGDLAFEYPLIITRDRFLIDGYGRWELAKQQGRQTLPCLEHDVTEQHALKWLIQTHRPSHGLSDFIRIELALDLEPYFQQQAVLNQQAGGRSKGLSKLTEAERVNSRREVARVAGVSHGNVRKVKYILANGCPSLLDAARSEEVSINQADKWSHDSGAIQQEKLRRLRIEAGIRKKARQLVAAHLAKSPVPEADEPVLRVSDLVRLVNQLSDFAPEQSDELGSIGISLLSGPGKAIFMTEELVQALQTQNEVPIR